MQGKIRHTLGLDGQHIVRGILGLQPGIPDGDPFINVLLSPWRDMEMARLSHDCLIKAIPVGEVFDLFAGALIDDNYVVGTALLSPYVLDVVFDAADPIVTRDAIGAGPLIPQLTDPAAVADLSKTQYLEVRRPGQGSVYIATAEIFRFYYMTSTRLGRALLDQNILDPVRDIYAPKHTLSVPSGCSRIVLRRNMLGSDAAAIARLVFSPDQIGLTRAKAIYSASTRTPVAGSNPLLARPPFDGKTSIACDGIKLGDQHDAPILVTRIRSCTGPMYFRELEWRFEADYYARSGGTGKPEDNTGGPGSKSRMAVDPNKLEVAYLDEGEPPSPQFIPQTIAIDDLESRFSQLAVVKITRVRKEGSDGPKRKKKKKKPLKKAALNNSAQSPSNKGEGRSSQLVDMTSGDNTSEGGEFEGDDLYRPSPVEILSYTLDVINEVVALSGSSAIDRVVSASSGRVLGHLVNVFPDNVGGVKKKWLYFDDARAHQRRPILIVELCKSEKYGYLADIVHRPGEQMSLMVFKSPDGTRLADDQHIALIKETASSRVARKETPIDVMKKHGIDLRHVSHRHKEGPRGKAEIFCEFLGLA